MIVGGNPQLRCGTANEGEQVQLACPQGVITGIQFASYGLPTGECGQFTVGTCHAQSSADVVRTRCLGTSSCSIGANNVAFGDPCSGVSKRLYVQARCGVLPAPTPTATPRPPSTPTRIATRIPTPTIAPGSAVLTVADAIIEPGRRHAGLSISLQNTAVVRGVEFTLTDPADDVTVSTTSPACEGVGRAAGFSCRAEKVGEFGAFSVALTGLGEIPPGDAPIATVFIDDKSPACSIGTDRRLEVRDVGIFDASGREVVHDARIGALVCACRGNPQYENGRPDVGDAAFCMDVSVGKQTPTGVQNLLTDLTCDGVIDVLDCSAILDVVVGRIDRCPKECLSVSQGAGATLTLPNVPPRPGEVVTVRVGLDNPTTIRGLQLSVSGTPGQVTLRGARAIERAASLQAQAYTADDGTTMTVGMISAGDDGIAPGQGPVVELDVEVAPDATRDTPLRASDVRAVGQEATLQEVPVDVAAAGSTLATNIGPTDTIISVADADALPPSGTVLIDREQVTYTGRSGNVLTGIKRGTNGTQADSHGEGAQVFVLDTGPVPTATPVPTASPTPTTAQNSGGGGGGGGGGCVLDPSAHDVGAPVLLMVAGWLLARCGTNARRRRAVR